MLSILLVCSLLPYILVERCGFLKPENMTLKTARDLSEHTLKYIITIHHMKVGCFFVRSPTGPTPKCRHKLTNQSSRVTYS